ncbi:hypothetical protein ACVMB2_006028 [Sinorhizobium meliloti]
MPPSGIARARLDSWIARRWVPDGSNDRTLPTLAPCCGSTASSSISRTWCCTLSVKTSRTASQELTIVRGVSRGEQKVDRLSAFVESAIQKSPFTADREAGPVAPDETTFAYLKDRPRAPKADRGRQGQAWDMALEYWKTLHTDEGAHYDRVVVLDAANLPPIVSWGSSPEIKCQTTRTADGNSPNLVLEDADVLQQSTELPFAGRCTVDDRLHLTTAGPRSQAPRCCFWGITIVSSCRLCCLPIVIVAIFNRR